MKLLCGALQTPSGFKHHLKHIMGGVFSPLLGEAFLNCFLMAFMVQLSWPELSCHLLERNLFGRAIKTKGSSVKGKEKQNKKKKQGKELESRGGGGRAGAWPHRGLADVLGEHACPRGCPQMQPEVHVISTAPSCPRMSITSGSLHSWESGQQVLSTDGCSY